MDAVAHSNDEVARVLETIADLFEARGSEPLRVSAHRAAAAAVRRERRSVAQIARLEGAEGLQRLPAIGRSIAETIEECVMAATRPEAPAPRPPRSPARPDDEAKPHGPPIGLLLETDRLYRSMARAGALPMIAPRLFNPLHEAWLPILHITRDGWAFAALFSNTARAHRFAKTHDWVVLHCARDGHQWLYTVVTERRGDVAGLRVVRGHERACRHYYATHRSQQAA